MPFGMWWIYFVMPCGDLLHAYRSRVFGWGYGHIPLFGAVVGVGAGLHAAAYHLEHHSTLSATGTLLTVVIPLSVYYVGLFAAVRRAHPHPRPAAPTGSSAARAVIVAAAIGLSVAGAPLPVTLWCWPVTVGDRGRRTRCAGHRHNAEVLACAAAGPNGRRRPASRARPRGRG